MFSQWKIIVTIQRTNNNNELMTNIDGFKDILTIGSCKEYDVTTNIRRYLSRIKVFMRIKYIYISFKKQKSCIFNVC